MREDERTPRREKVHWSARIGGKDADEANGGHGRGDRCSQINPGKSAADVLRDRNALRQRTGRSVSSVREGVVCHFAFGAYRCRSTRINTAVGTKGMGDPDPDTGK